MSEERNVAPAGEETQELKRGIKGWQVAFIGLGGVIGSCYFLGLGICVHDMGPAVFIAFAVVGVIVYGLMIAYAELLVNLPRKGSFVAYTNAVLQGQRYPPAWDGHSGSTGYATVLRKPLPLLRYYSP